jgi:tetratricopeptide (TPR) repeat protein
MKKGFIILSLTVSIIFQFSCKSASSENSNTANSNSNLSIQANNQTQDEPLPAFTDANTALAEGKRLLDTDKTEKSIEAFQQAIKLNPNLAEAHFQLGIAYALLEDEQPVVETDEESTSNSSKKTKKKGGKEEILPLTRSQKAFQSAAEIYEKITEENPKDDAAFFNLGRSYNKLNKDEEAAKVFKQAVKLKPDDADYQFELGEILIKLSQYDEAIVALKKAKSLDPGNLQIDDALEKAEAGERRIKFGVSPTPAGTPKPKGDKALQRPTPPLKIEDAPIKKPNANQ